MLSAAESWWSLVLMLRAVGFVCRVCTHAVNGCAFVLIVVHCYVVSLCRVVRAVVLHIVDLVDLSWCEQQLAVLCGAFLVWHGASSSR